MRILSKKALEWDKRVHDRDCFLYSIELKKAWRERYPRERPRSRT